MNAWELKREAALRARMEKIRECRTSGKTVKVWCEENGIAKSTYYKWERMCLAKAESNLKAERPALPQGSSLIKFNPDVLPVAGNQEEQSVPSSAVSAELVIRVGCVSMDISSGMPVDRIAELVSALNSHA